MTPEEVKQLVERLEKAVTHEACKPLNDCSPSLEVTKLNLEAASALSLLAQEREELRAWSERAAHALSDAQYIIEQFIEPDDVPSHEGNVESLTRQITELAAEHIARAALKES